MGRGVLAWYNGATRTVELTSQTAVWYRSGKPPVPLRWVLVRDPQANSPHRLCCALTGPWNRHRFWNGLCCAGNWRSPSRKCALTWAWRPNASGRIAPSPAPRQSHGALLLDHPGGSLDAGTTAHGHRTAAWYAKPSPFCGRHRSGAPPLVAGVRHCPTQNLETRPVFQHPARAK